MKAVEVSLNLKFKRLRCIGVLAFTMIVTTMTSPAEPALTNAIAQARGIVRAEIESKVPGFSVAVVRNGKLVWSEGFGLADLSAKIPVTPLTRFRIGSVSKPLTSAGLALLVERGDLDMDAPVQKYIPDFPQKDGTITIRMLAGHLSGIRNYRGSEAVSNRAYPDLRSGLKIFENDPLESPPGSKFSYTSYNWNVIGVAMEVAAKQDFLHYMDDKVFKPLDMTNTYPDWANVMDPQRTQFYEMDTTGKFIQAPRVNLSYAWPSGGFLSTSEDLARFGSALMQPGFLRPESRKLLFTSQKTSDGKTTHYGVGWFVGKIAFHGGDSIGGSSILLLNPESGIVVAILTNRGHLALENENGKTKLGKFPEEMKFQRERIVLKIARAFAS